MNGETIASAVSFIQSAKKMPRWAVLRLASVTGVNAGWWIMAIVSGLVGAVTAVLCVTVVHHYLKGGESPLYVEVEEDESVGMQEGV